MKASNYKIIGKSEDGIHIELPELKTAYIYWNEIEQHRLVSEMLEKFELDWPNKWKEIKESLPSGPTLPYTPQPKVGLVIEGADLYFLTIMDLLLIGIGRITAEKLILSIGKSKSQPLQKVIYALGIKDIGEETSRLLAKNFNYLDELGRASVEKLCSIDNLGETRVVSIFSWFHQEQNWRTIEKLRMAPLDYAFGYKGLELEISNMERQSIEADQAKEDYLKSLKSTIVGKVFMFTGRLTLFTRVKAENLVEDREGIVGNSVTKNTDFLVVGEKPGSKLVQATLLGTKILSEKEFLELIK